MTLEKLEKKHKHYYILMASLLLITLVTVVKRLFVGLDIDEEYAIALAYRIARGDIILKELWEPHQLSALLPGLFVYIWINTVHSVKYLVLYLRVIGVFIQAVSATLWYIAFSKTYNKVFVFLSSMIIMNVLPKWIQSPEFANTQIWALIITISLWMISQNVSKSKQVICAIFMGISTIIMVFAYPTCIIIFLVFAIAERKNLNLLITYVATCAAFGLVFVVYLINTVGLDHILTYLGYIMSDGSHTASFTDRIASYGSEFVYILLWLAIYSAFGAFIELIACKVKRKQFSLCIFCDCTIIIACLDQLRIWFISEEPNVHSQLRFLLPVLTLIVMNVKNKKDTDKRIINVCIATSFGSLISVLALTNLTVRASFVHLIPALLMYFISSDLKELNDKVTITMRSISIGLWLAVTFISMIFLVRVNEGWHEDVFLVRQKALFGAAKNVYYPYMDGYEYNCNTELLKANVSDGANVFYLGSNQLIYTIGEYNVCAASIISTPVYDSKYIDYFEINPQKTPEYVVINNDYWGKLDDRSDAVKNWVVNNFDFDNSVKNDFITILKRK